jgi:RNA polymerase sigma-70 factor (ECF subfamily)
MDIVQSIWADLLSGFQNGQWVFTNPQQLRAFLVKVTRNRLVDRVRQQQTSLRLEERLDSSQLRGLARTQQAQPGAQLEADEIWQRLLRLCPTRHRKMLELKRQGLTLAEIAAQTGLHESSVRRLLYELAARLAESESSCPAPSPRP